MNSYNFSHLFISSKIAQITLKFNLKNTLKLFQFCFVFGILVSPLTNNIKLCHTNPLP